MKKLKLIEITKKTTPLTSKAIKEVKGGYRHGDSEEFIVQK